MRISNKTECIVWTAIQCFKNLVMVSSNISKNLCFFTKHFYYTIWHTVNCKCAVQFFEAAQCLFPNFTNRGRRTRVSKQVKCRFKAIKTADSLYEVDRFTGQWTNGLRSSEKKQPRHWWLVGHRHLTTRVLVVGQLQSQLDVRVWTHLSYIQLLSNYIQSTENSKHYKQHVKKYRSSNMILEIHLKVIR